jgi:hypothetical protein
LASLKKLKPLVRGFWSCNQPSATAGNFGTSELYPRSRRILETHYAPPDCRNSPAAFRLPLLARLRHSKIAPGLPLSEEEQSCSGNHRNAGFDPVLQQGIEPGVCSMI